MHNLKSGELHPVVASMKALPKRKGNDLFPPEVWALGGASMKALPKRKGNASSAPPSRWPPVSLNESPSQKEGKCPPRTGWVASPPASMKALPKRKGNIQSEPSRSRHHRLNESPSEKEGKSALAREGMLGESDPQ